jgi:hypothetical protein
LLLLLALAACTSSKPRNKATKPALKTSKVKAGMPEGFRVVGRPRVEPAYLEPGGAWRALRSRIKILQAEAVARGIDIMVTFEESAVHATTKGGTRRTWELPTGLRLFRCPSHLLLASDYTTRLYRADHSQVPLGGEVTVVTARVAGRGQKAEEFRLTIKGGRTIRSISTAG